MVKHSFTPAEATRTLPLVKRIVRDLIALGGELRDLAPHQREEGVAAQIRQLETEIKDLVLELERIGCTYKDWGFEAGLVDFPSEIDGEPVLLCWRSDEDGVGFYHTYDGGFAGRTPIPAELLEHCPDGA